MVFKEIQTLDWAALPMGIGLAIAREGLRIPASNARLISRVRVNDSKI